MPSSVPRSGTDWLKRQMTKISEGGPLAVSEKEAAAVEVESWLQSRGVEYAPPVEIPMILIDEKKSRANQARKTAIVADSVDRFTAAYKKGVQMPPIVAYINGSRLVIIDGNNRQAAARKAGKDTILGVVISEETPSELITLLTVEANARHGVTPDLGWRLMQAFHLCELGFSDADAAEASAVSLSQFQTAKKVREADQRAAALRITRFTELPLYARQALAAVKDDAVFYQASKCAIDTSMTIEEIRDLLRMVKTKGSETARIDYIGEIAKERAMEHAARKAVGRTANRLNSPKQSFATSIGKFLAIDPAAFARTILTRHERDLVAQRLKQTEEQLLQLQIALDQVRLEDEED